MSHLEAEREVEALPRAAPVGRHIRRRDHFLQLLKEGWLARIGVAIVAIALFLTAFGPYIAPFDTIAATPDIYESPSTKHFFGTDGSGFDVFSRVIAAPRYDVTIALVATFLSLVLGTILGLVAAFFRGWGGELIMRGSDSVQAFPLFVLAIIFVIGAGRSLTNIVIIVALLSVPIFVRLTRSEVLSLRERAFVESATANGSSRTRIAFRHVLPNAMVPGFAQASITMGYAIIIAAGLSFLGAGVQPPTPEWGTMIASGATDIIRGRWWVSIFPGAAMALTVFGFAVVGDMIQTVVLRRT
jgi:peptide/nickel transport system permease protein